MKVKFNYDLRRFDNEDNEIILNIDCVLDVYTTPVQAPDDFDTIEIEEARHEGRLIDLTGKEYEKIIEAYAQEMNEEF